MAAKSSVVNYSYPYTKSETAMGYGNVYLLEDHRITELHPDGQPWDKCCGCKEKRFGVPGVKGTDFCAFRRNGFANTARLDKDVKSCVNNRFVCVHQATEDGYLRVCAGWHAMFGRKMKKFGRKMKNDKA